MYHDEIRDLERVAALFDEAERVLSGGSDLSLYSLSARRRQMRTDLASARSRCRELLHYLHFRERNQRRGTAQAAHAT